MADIAFREKIIGGQSASSASSATPRQVTETPYRLFHDNGDGTYSEVYYTSGIISEAIRRPI